MKDSQVVRQMSFPGLGPRAKSAAYIKMATLESDNVNNCASMCILTHVYFLASSSFQCLVFILFSPIIPPTLPSLPSVRINCWHQNSSEDGNCLC